jgi:hypothetical protein
VPKPSGDDGRTEDRRGAVAVAPKPSGGSGGAKPKTSGGATRLAEQRSIQSTKMVDDNGNESHTRQRSKKIGDRGASATTGTIARGGEKT